MTTTSQTDIAALFAAIRQECSPHTWSKAVKLSRSGGVIGEREASDEVALRVAEAGRAVSPTVVLSLVDEDWSCDCGSDIDPCEHVAAAVIAFKQARSQGQPLPRGSFTMRVGYRLRRVADGVALDRVLIGSSRPEEPLRGSLVRPRDEGPRVAASKEDLAVELALGQRPAGQRLPPVVARRVVEALSKCHDVTLDGDPIAIGEARAAFVAELTDDPPTGGFRLVVKPAPDVDEPLGQGVLRVGRALHPAVELALSADEIAALRQGRVFAPEHAAMLVGQLLPALKQKLVVNVMTRRLPTASSEPPHLEIEVQERDGGLYVLPTLCYGRPLLARVTQNRLELVDTSRAVPLRDEAAEKRLAARLRELGLRPGFAEHVFDREAVALAERLTKARAVQISAPALLNKFGRRSHLTPRIGVDDDGLQLEFEIDGDTAHVSAERVLAAWRSGHSLLPIRGSMGELPLDWLSRYGHRIESLLRARALADDQNAPLGAAARLALAQLCHDLDYPAPPDLERLRSQLEQLAGIPEAQLPPLTVTLRSYQRAGVDWLCLLRNLGLSALLADDMGLGKTLQALCAFDGKTLVVAPTSVLRNWLNEARRFRPDLRCALYHGASRELDPDADLTVTSYALLRLDGELLARQTWRYVVLDEAQQIKNPESQVAQAAFALTATWKLALTGTPVENRLQDLWSIFHFLQPGLLGGRADFDQRVAEPIARGDLDAIVELRRKTAPLIMRRKKVDVAKELPPRTEVVLECDLSPDEREVYEALKLSTRQQVLDKLGAGRGSVMAALEALLRLRQACCHVGLLPGSEQQQQSSKIELLLERLVAAGDSGHKSLVFSQWTSLLDRIEPALEQAALPYCRLDGATRDRQAVVDAFGRDEGPPVMLISLKAGGVGINLTAADHVYIVDPWWNPATEDQAADRAHRIGQTRPVMVFRLVASDTVEQRIVELQEKKRALADAALSGSGASRGLSQGELLELLR